MFTERGNELITSFLLKNLLSFVFTITVRFSMGPKIVFPVMTTMYVVPGSRSEIIALAVFVTYDLLKLLSGDETLT
jgi:hypothetical protein